MGVNALMLTNEKDKVGTHSDSEGKILIGTLVLHCPKKPRPVLVRPKSCEDRDKYNSISMRLGTGCYYTMNDDMQEYYVHSVPTVRANHPASTNDSRLTLVCRYGKPIIVKDTGEVSSIEKRFLDVARHSSVIYGAICSMDEMWTYTLSYLHGRGAHRP